jgi:hypothetical protein
MPGNAHYELIVTASREVGFLSTGIKNYWGVRKALKAHLRLSSGLGRTALEGCMSFLTSGRPYVLPLMFDENEAKSFAADLTTAGCDVRVVPFGE